MDKQSIIYPHIMITKSSAGSGKTHNLALRYLQNLLQRNKPTELKNILAITFTNKAAQEMRSRIIEWMKRAALELPLKKDSVPVTQRLLDPSLLFHNNGAAAEKYQALPALTHLEISSELAAHLEQLLRHFHDFKVSTIDSFNTFILKSLAFRLDLSPDFEVLLDSEKHIDMALGEVYEDILGNAATRRIFDDFIDQYARIEPKKLKWNPDKLIKNLIGFVWEKEREKGLEIDPSINESTLIRSRREITQLIGAVKTSLLSDGTIIPNKKFLTALENSSHGNIFAPVKLKNWIFKEFAQGKDGLLNKGSAPVPESVISAFSSLRDELGNYFFLSSRHKFAVASRIYELFVTKLKIVTRRDRVVLINEFNLLLRSVLETDASGIPKMPSGLYLYLAERYHHFLIDEFQDTNTLQWINLEALITNALSEGGSLFVVGDEKQSIYRWRGGNYELVNRITDHFYEGKYPVENIYQLDLNKSYRSSGVIVNFNNALFSLANIRNAAQNDTEVAPASELEEHLKIYQGKQQAVVEGKEDRGYVYAEIFEPGPVKAIEKFPIDETSEVAKPLDIDLSEANEDDLTVTQEELIRKRLLEKIEEVRQRHDLKDIAILTRKNAEANTVVKWLLEQKIPVESELTISLRSHPYINELVSFLQFISEPGNNIAFMNFITGDVFTGLCGCDRDTVFAWINITLLAAPQSSLYIAFQKWKPDVWKKQIKGLFRLAGYMPLYEFVSLMMKEWCLFERFPDYASYFFRLLEIIQSTTAVSTDSLADFIEFWNTSETNDSLFLLKTTENMDAIHVLTIHKAKGLEFSVVFVPFAGGKGQEEHSFVDESPDTKKLEFFHIVKEDIIFSQRLASIYHNEKLRRFIDEVNDLYVAFTRPKEALFVFFSIGKKNNNRLSGLIFNESTGKIITKGTLESTGGVKIRPVSSAIETAPSGWVFPEEEEKGTLQWLELIKTRIDVLADLNFDKYRANVRGMILHDTLSRIIQYDQISLADLLDSAMSDSGVSEGRDEMLALLEKNFTIPEFKKLFKTGDGAVVTERDIVNEKGELKRVDRLLFFQDKMVLVDYKSGAKQEEDHFSQIREYGRLLEKMYPEKKLEMILVYLDDAELVHVRAGS